LVVQVGAIKIYVTTVEALKKKKDRMKLNLPPVIPLMAYYAENDQSRPLIARLYR
jgi:hypothetical protein